MAGKKFTGFDTDGFDGEKILELCEGYIINRDDPEGLGRVKLRIPGKMEETAWAKVEGGGAKDDGSDDTPPLNTNMYVQFLNGDPSVPVCRRADHAYKRPPVEVEKLRRQAVLLRKISLGTATDAERSESDQLAQEIEAAMNSEPVKETFPEYEHPDVHVFGRGPFRLVIDNRDEVDEDGNDTGLEKRAMFKFVKMINGVEEPIVWLEFNHKTNSARLHATSALGLSAGGLPDIDCDGDVQVKGRKVLTSERPIS